MIKIIKDIEPYFGFMEAINKMDAYSDPLRSTLSEYASSCRKNDNVTFLTERDGILTGVFSFLILPEEKYAESLWALSMDEEAYEEAMDYLYQNYPGYECYFVYNPKNEILSALLKKENAEFSSVQREMEFKGSRMTPGTHKVQRLTEEYYEEYTRLHTKDIYWTAEKIIASNEFVTFVSLKDNQVTGYIDLSPDDTECHIMDILVSLEKRNEGYGRSLMLETLNYSFPKKITLEVDEDNIPARHLYEKLGFRYLERKDSVTVYLKLENKNS